MKTKAISIKKRERKLSPHLVVITVVFFLYSFTLIFPVLWLLYNSTKTSREFFQNPWTFPGHPFSGLTNFGVVFEEFGLGTMFFNTILLSVLSPFINIFCTACCAYAYAKHNFLGKKLFYILAMIPLVVNLAGTQPAVYKLINNLGLYDNLFGILLMSTGGFGFNFLLISSVFVNISPAYKEAAQIDGAGNWRIFLAIYLPLIKSVLIALYILSFINTWNDYLTPYLYLPSHETLAVGIYRLQSRLTVGNDKYQNDYPKLFAAMLMSILPVIILFGVFQKMIMQFSLDGGVKG